MAVENSNTIKCKLCGYAMPVKATICPHCGMNVALNRLIEKIPQGESYPEPPFFTPRGGQLEGEKTDELRQDSPSPKLFPEMSGARVNRLDPEPDPEEISQSQSGDSPVLDEKGEEITVIAAEPVFATPQAYVPVLPAADEVEPPQPPRSHGFSRIWILSAVLLAGLVFLFVEYLGQRGQLQALRNDTRDPQSTLTAQAERLHQAESTILAQQLTITAQQNTITAQPTLPASQINLDKILLFGPADGALVHNPDGLMKTYWANQDSRNFILSVVLVNPYPSIFHSWSSCIRFRRNFTDEYRLTIFSNRQWEMTLGLAVEPFASGAITNLKTGEGDSNTVYLEVRDGIASLKVNDVLVPNIDVSAYQEAGDIGIAIGSRKGDEVDGKTTSFKEFTLWKFP